jgi:CheY-like chemotaxis protein
VTVRAAVLLVDDERVVLESLRLQIRRMCGDGLAIECAEGVAEAWEVLEELRNEGVSVVLVLSDWLMPVTRGDAFLEEVKLRFPQMKRVMLTGQADDQAVRRVREGGLADLLLLKPWSDQDLVAMMELIPLGA